jgi:hypothetical protein
VTARRALLVVAVAGAAIFALSFVNGWIVHDREIRGEGFRHSEILLSAWRSVAVPVLSAAALIALAAAVAAVAMLVRPGVVPPWTLVAASVAVLALVAATLVPLGWNGHTTSTDLRPGYLAIVGVVVAVAMLVAAWVAAGFGTARLAQLAVLGVLLAVLAVGGRWAVLAASGPSNQAWEEGTYVRTGDNLPALTLTIEDGTYRIDDRWAGTWEGSGGWTVALDADPACPDSRGAYHARRAGTDDQDLRFVKIVDTCQDGERARELEAGIWERQP